VDVDRIFTLATPLGFPQNYELPRRVELRLFHLRGGRDAVPFGWRHNPGGGEWVITFPDEGHCSLHAGAKENGVADLITALSGGSRRSIHVDDRGVIHPWTFCRSESSPQPFGLLGEFTELVVCNGMHDEELEVLKAGRALAPEVTLRFCAYLAIRRRLINMELSLGAELRRLRTFGREAETEVGRLRAENHAMESRIAEFDSGVDQFLDAVRERFGVDLRKMRSALQAAEAVSTASMLGPVQLLELIGLMEEALQSHQSLLGRAQAMVVPLSRLSGKSR
jgi:hypothetical protein